MRWYQRFALVCLATLLQSNFASAQFGGLKLPSFGGSSGGSKPPSFNLPKLPPPKPQSFSAPKPNLSLPKPNLSLPKPNLSTPKPNLSLPKPNTNFPKPNVNIPKPNPTIAKPSLPNIPKPNPTIAKPSIPKPNTTIAKPNVLGGNLPKPNVNIPKPTVNIPKPTGILGNSGPTFSGGPIKGKALAEEMSDPIKKKPPVVTNPPKKDPKGGITYESDTATSVKKDPKPKPPVVVTGPRVTPKPDKTKDILEGLIPIVPILIDAGRNTNPQPIFTQPTGPGFVRPQPTQEYQPQPATYVQPAPQAIPLAAPINSIVTKKRFAFNPLSNAVTFNFNSTQAETDARQQLEATEAKRMLDIAMAENLRNMPDGPQRTQLLKEWEELVSSGSKTEDVQKFLDRNGPPPLGNNTLPAAVLDFGKMRQEFGNYADKLNNGTFSSPEERDQALADLQTSLTTFNQTATPQFAVTLQEKMSNMQNFNTMGKLAAATAEMENPYPTLIQGATQMEMPLCFVSEMTGYPVMGCEPIAEQVFPTTGPNVTPAMILLANPPATGQPVGYRLGGYGFEMASGDEQQLDRQYVLSFDTGTGAQRQYTLSDGYYEWRVDPQTGWDVYKTKVAITIDNSRYDGTFEYLVNGELVRLAPGEVAEHASDSLIEVAFHSGREGLEHRKLLKPGQYLVGLDPAYGALDLFKTEKVEAFEAKQPEYLSSTDLGGSRATQRERVQALLAQMKKPGAKDDKPADAVATTAGGEKNTGKKKVSALGKSKPAASPDDLLKMIKPKAAANAVPEPPAPGIVAPPAALAEPTFE